MVSIPATLHRAQLATDQLVLIATMLRDKQREGQAIFEGGSAPGKTTVKWERRRQDWMASTSKILADYDPADQHMFDSIDFVQRAHLRATLTPEGTKAIVLESMELRLSKVRLILARLYEKINGQKASAD